MFDMGWTELLVIGVVALIVVGPKDLPKMFRTLGQMTAKARSMAREFSRAMEDAADASGVKDVARDLRGVADPKDMGLDEFNKMKNWDPLKDSPKQKPRADAKDAAPAPNADEDEDEMDRISAEMERLRTESKTKRAQADAPAVDVAPQDGAAPDKPAQDTDFRA